MVERKIKKFFSRRLNPYKNVRVEAGLYKPRFAAGGKKRKKKRRGHAAPGYLLFIRKQKNSRHVAGERSFNNQFVHVQ